MQKLVRRGVAAVAALNLAGSSMSIAAGRAQLAQPVVTALEYVSGTPLHTRCVVDQGGYIEPEGHAGRRLRLIELQPAICRRLDALAATPAPVGSRALADESAALLVAVHEAVHLSPYGAEADEGHVECMAVQLVDITAERIGLSADVARAAGHAAWLAHERLPGPDNWMVGLHEIPNYKLDDCYDGGPLDLHPGSSDWPN